MIWPPPVTERPEQLGFHPPSLENAFGVVRRFVEEERIPGAVATVGSPGGMLAPRAYGWLSWIPKRLPIAADAIFDCASVTKVVVTTTLALRLIDEGIVRLDDPVALWIPEFLEAGTPTGGLGSGDAFVDPKVKERVTLRHLLTHTSGLSAWVPLYESVRPGPPAGSGRLETDTPYDQVIASVCRQPLTRPPGTAVEYSCLGFILLGEIIRRARGAGLDVLAAREIFSPLGMVDSAYNPSPGLHSRIAATELVDGAPLVGVVHDENARSMGGVSGNAGLFSTAEDLGRFALMLLAKGRAGDVRLLSPAAIEEATRDHTGHLGGDSRGLGWVIKGRAPYSSAGDLFSPESFGHTGFTGTSLWIDPKREIFAVLLTNRVHPTRQNDAHIALRALFHNAVAASV